MVPIKASVVRVFFLSTLIIGISRVTVRHLFFTRASKCVKVSSFPSHQGSLVPGVLSRLH